MAEIGEILEVKKVYGQLEARIDCGWGSQITATIAQAGNADMYPLKGDRVMFHRTTGQEIVISAIYSNDNEASVGEWRVFSRDSAGAVKAVIWAKNDGSIDITNASGKTVNVGGASDFVAMAAKTNAMFDLINNIITAWSPVAQDGGAALKTTWSGMWASAQDVDSTNLKAD